MGKDPHKRRNKKRKQSSQKRKDQKENKGKHLISIRARTASRKKADPDDKIGEEDRRAEEEQARKISKAGLNGLQIKIPGSKIRSFWATLIMVFKRLSGLFNTISRPNIYVILVTTMTTSSHGDASTEWSKMPD